MNESKTEEYPNLDKSKTNQSISLENKLPLLFLGLLSISFIGYFAFQKHWFGIIFAHFAAVSIMGFYGCLAGSIAKKKGYSFRRAYQIGFFLPIVLGGISAFLFVSQESSLPITCGGWISLAAGIVIVIIYSFIKHNIKRNKSNIKKLGLKIIRN